MRARGVLAVLCGVALAVDAAEAQPPAAGQVALPTTAADVTAPATGVVMHPEYAKAVGRLAYVWGWPMVNMLNRSASITGAPEPGWLNDVLPVAPRGQVGMLADYIDPGQTFVTCPNQDVVYGLGFFSLDEEPVVAQVPDFGDRFWVYALYDARTDQFAELGKPYKTKPGFYLLVGPNWKGDKPAGIEAVIRSSTSLANAIPRVFMDDTPEDRKAIQSAIDQVVFCPLKDFDGKMKTKDWAQAPAIPGPKSEGGGETKWVVPEKFFDLGTKNKNLQKGADGSLTLYVGAKSPGAAKEANWLPAPNGHFSLYIRSYWGQQGILDGSWKPPVIRKVQ